MTAIRIRVVVIHIHVAGIPLSNTKSGRAVIRAKTMMIGSENRRLFLLCVLNAQMFARAGKPPATRALPARAALIQPLLVKRCQTTNHELGCLAVAWMDMAVAPGASVCHVLYLAISPPLVCKIISILMHMIYFLSLTHFLSI